MNNPNELPQESPAAGGMTEEEAIQKIIEMLSAGVTPEELIQEGIPAQLVELAMQVMEQQEAPPMSTAATTPGGASLQDDKGMPPQGLAATAMQ